MEFPNLGPLALFLAACLFTIGYCFVPQPYFWQSFAYGSPPLAIRAGMIAVALLPWIVALSTKVNPITFLTGVSHERLNVLHRWLAYLCLALSIVHVVPFYIVRKGDETGYRIFQTYFPTSSGYIYTTGIAALVPLTVLCLHSLPVLRRRFYETFVAIHVPVSVVFLGLMFWHCKNYLTSWNYLAATACIWITSYVARLFLLNWSNPWRSSWLIADEAGVMILSEDAIKITIPTRTKWRPGQYVYLRIPGVSIFDNHPFTIASLCSNDFPSEYGDRYRDMVLVFRPFAGFTKKVLDNIIEHGPWHTYRAFIDGPYGGTSRPLHTFDHAVLFAGGSGITALISQLLDLVKRMREGRAVTKTLTVIWALRRPEVMAWFREELRICREHAPAGAIKCNFYITTAKRQPRTGQLVSAQTPTRPVSIMFHDRVNDAFQSTANHRLSTISTPHRHSSLIAAEASTDPAKEKTLRDEETDHIRPLPQAHLLSNRTSEKSLLQSSSISSGTSLAARRHRAAGLSLAIPPVRRQIQSAAVSPPTEGPYIPFQYIASTPSTSRRARASQASTAAAPHVPSTPPPVQTRPGAWDVGFPSTPTEFQKSLMRFAFMPGMLPSARARGDAHGDPRNGAGAAGSDPVGEAADAWSTQFGRPDIGFTLRDMLGGRGSLGRDNMRRADEGLGKTGGARVCVYVCGPASMRVDVARAATALQAEVWEGRWDEIWLHAENYAIRSA